MRESLVTAIRDCLEDCEDFEVTTRNIMNLFQFPDLKAANTYLKGDRNIRWEELQAASDKTGINEEDILSAVVIFREDEWIFKITKKDPKKNQTWMQSVLNAINLFHDCKMNLSRHYLSMVTQMAQKEGKKPNQLMGCSPKLIDQISRGQRNLTENHLKLVIDQLQQDPQEILELSGVTIEMEEELITLKIPVQPNK